MTEPAAAQVLLVVELTTRPGAQREMREALDRLVDATRPERGVVRFEVGFDPDDDTRVLGYEIWASQDALDEHKAKAHTREFLAGPASSSSIPPCPCGLAAGGRCAKNCRPRTCPVLLPSRRRRLRRRVLTVNGGW